MSCCVDCSASPCTCETDFTRIGPGLAQALYPCIDSIRDLYSCFGLRTQEVALIRTRWSGGERGVGVEQVINERVLLPNPSVYYGGNRALRAAGVQETGQATVKQISPSMNEDELSGMGEGGEPIPMDEAFYWEIREFNSDSSYGVRRRYTLAGPPNYDAMKFGWVVRLDRAAEDRVRGNGDPR